MTYLLDTHYMIWAITETSKIAKNIKNIISDPDNQIIVSTVSFWEISLKSAIGKLNLTNLSPSDLPANCLQMGFDIRQLTAEDSSTYHRLTATYHKDPFDRMLIWQAIRNNYILISADSNVKKYTSEGLQILSQK